ncbi:MAG TPA: serine protease, partial [Bacteroidales bacterium]|nr:serine protease [Bacteroidales bacterium]
MIKKISFYAFLFFLTTYLSAQTPAKYWIQFTDKNNSEYSIENPDRYLSERAIEKRKMFNIPITETDLPVNQLYINNILNLDTGIVLFTKSKWFNAITVYTEDSLFSEKIQKLPFVKDWERTISMKETERFVHKDSIYIYKIDRGEVEKKSLPRELNYGETNRQIRLNNVHWLHRMGFYGENIVLMVMDAGFHNVDTLKYFQNLRDEQRLLGVRNFVQLGVNPFKKMSHGTMVLSCIVGYMPDKYIGTAPKVSVYLAKTEDERSENKIEEDNWVAGIEWADSLGVDIV